MHLRSILGLRRADRAPGRSHRPGRRDHRSRRQHRARQEPVLHPRRAVRAPTSSSARTRSTAWRRRSRFAGSYGDGLQIVDVTDPADAELVATWDCGISQGDVQVFQRADLGGRWFVAYTHDDGYDVRRRLDLRQGRPRRSASTSRATARARSSSTSPTRTNPKTVSFVPFAQGSHNKTVHPSGKYLYNSNSDLITSPLPAIEIVDITDIAKPKAVGEFAAADASRASAPSRTTSRSTTTARAPTSRRSRTREILDTTDPAQPELASARSSTRRSTSGTSPRRSRSTTRSSASALPDRRGRVRRRDRHRPVPQRRRPRLRRHRPARGGAGQGRLLEHRRRRPDRRRRSAAAPRTSSSSTRRQADDDRLLQRRRPRGRPLGARRRRPRRRRASGMKQLGWYRFADSDTWAVKAPFGRPRRLLHVRQRPPPRASTSTSGRRARRPSRPACGSRPSSCCRRPTPSAPSAACSSSASWSAS